MPDVGGRKLAGEFGNMLAELRKTMDETKLEIAAAVTEVQSELATGKEVAKALRAEADDVRQAFGAVLGNNPPDKAPE